MPGNLRRVLLAASIVAAVIVGSTACGSSESGSTDPIKSTGVLRVGTEGVYSPFSYHDQKTG
jgi:ABC-type amino acid transport substrate-binding protein